MSERTGKSDFWTIVIMIFLVVGLIAVMAVKFKTDIRSLQRRVGELEQRQ